MTALFIAATGTDAGKTYVTAGLLRQLRAGRLMAEALKPVVSGFDPAEPAGSDPALLLEALGQPVTRETLDSIAPLRFAAPLAPNMAARREGYPLQLDEIVAICERRISDARGPLLIEGAGGVMSPIADGATCLDLVAALRIPCLLVAGTYLGGISHTLTAVEAMTARGCRLDAIVLNETPGAPVSLDETRAELAVFLPSIAIVPIPRGAVDFAALARALGLTS